MGCSPGGLTEEATFKLNSEGGVRKTEQGGKRNHRKVCVGGAWRPVRDGLANNEVSGPVTRARWREPRVLEASDRHCVQLHLLPVL